jgi:hypothetical protein
MSTHSVATIERLRSDRLTVVVVVIAAAFAYRDNSHVFPKQSR